MDTQILVDKLLESLKEKSKNLSDFFVDSFKGAFVLLKAIDDSKDVVYSGDLAKTLGISTARMSAILNSLSKSDLIIREDDLKDKRKTIVKLTNKGKKELEERKQSINAQLNRFVSRLSEDEIETFFAIIQKI